MIYAKYAFFLMMIVILASCQKQDKMLTDNQMHEKAERLSKEFIILDTHIDLRHAFVGGEEDISAETGTGHFDYPRAAKGGLNAAFMSVFISPSYQEKGGGKSHADSLIDLLDGLAAKYPDKFALAVSPSDVLGNFRAGKFSLAMGMENGEGIEDDLKNIQYFYNRGIRYITLTHGKDNRICDSSYDTAHKWHGLSPFGKNVVRELNRVGIMVDVSHITDDAFYQVMEISKAPVIASHSACRYYTPGFERNMSDEMIKLLAEKRGVIQITFGSYFMSGEYQKKADETRNEIRKYLTDHHLTSHDSAGIAYIRKFRDEHQLDPGDVSLVVDHIDHAVQVAGVDHVGLGSDFDGVSSLPTGIEDVSMYPNIIYELIKRGYSDADIKKICGENLLRVWSEVGNAAANLSAARL